MSSFERDPNKRRVKPVEQACLLDFDEESSDDSDFRIEDHQEISDDDDDSLDSRADDHEENSSEDDADSIGSDVVELKELTLLKDESRNGVFSLDNIIQQDKCPTKTKFDEKDSQVLICCGCLGDQSDGINEIVECDGCGITVHEACYGISDTGSLASTDSLSPTTPWFCESCKAGVTDPDCELCPNRGGIFKETDVGKWVHLVCALYVPGVAFGEVDKLAGVTLFEMPYSRWGARLCSLCDDARFARTGVCVGCDAGMCKTYFHVTCAQKEGFLSEAHSEEVDQADPFYAHCKLHSDKTLVKRRKKNYLALQRRSQYRKMQFEQEGHKDMPAQVRIQRKLEKQTLHYIGHKSLKPPPWVPTQKMPRLLTTSASACRKLLLKAELMGINTTVLETQEAQNTALIDVRKKWYISPAFSVEFIAYYLDRNERLKDMKSSWEKLTAENNVLSGEQQALRIKYDEVLQQSTEVNNKNAELKQKIHKYHSAILSARPNKNLPNIDELGKPISARAPQPMMVPTAAALKMGVGFPLKNIPPGRKDRVLSSHANKETLTLNECGICRQGRDQHLLAKCDTCRMYYHLGCLNPPLTRLPKKSKLYGWQCSECDKTSDSEVEEVKTPRRSRSRYSRDNIRSDGETAPSTPPKLKIKSVALDSDESPSRLERNGEPMDRLHVILSNGIEGHKSAKKRRREKHRNRYSPELGGSFKDHKRKKKKRSIDLDESLPHPRITIKIKSIPLPDGEVASESNPKCFYVPNEADDNAPPPPPKIARIEQRESRLSRSPRAAATEVHRDASGKAKSPAKKAAGDNSCDVCGLEGASSNSVKCDECQKSYHFTCLDPPLKKSPKRRGYSWHCEDCDPTSSE